MNAGNVGRDDMVQEIHAFKGTTRAAIWLGWYGAVVGRCLQSSAQNMVAFQILPALGGVEFSFPGQAPYLALQLWSRFGALLGRSCLPISFRYVTMAVSTAAAATKVTIRRMSVGSRGTDIWYEWLR